MKITLWGTRGSIPTPSTTSFITAKYGGDTTCVSIESGEHFVIIDGGSGLRLLGLDLMKRPTPVQATFFFSHVHWDHIQGFPFFVPGFNQGNHFELYGPRLASFPGFVGSILEKALRGQQEDLNFPVQLKDMPASMAFKDLPNERSTVELKGPKSTLIVSASPLNHPGGCSGYRVEEHVAGQPVRSFAFATDTEHLSDINPNVQALCKNADLVLYDSQYTRDEYEGLNGNFSRRGWGHSTWEWGLKECQAAGAKHLLLHHHDPLHDDDAVNRIEAMAQEAAKPLNIRVDAAAQKAVYDI